MKYWKMLALTALWLAGGVAAQADDERGRHVGRGHEKNKGLALGRQEQRASDKRDRDGDGDFDRDDVNWNKNRKRGKRHAYGKGHHGYGLARGKVKTKRHIKRRHGRSERAPGLALGRRTR